MAKIFLVDVDAVPVYTSYFDVTLIPATIFFFHGEHVRITDTKSPDNTKWIGSFQTKDNFSLLVETIYRKARHGRYIVHCPFDTSAFPSYNLLYQDF